MDFPTAGSCEQGREKKGHRQAVRTGFGSRELSLFRAFALIEHVITLERSSMSVSVADVEKIASLAKLSFSEEEKAAFTAQFNQILALMEKLKELDTENVPVTAHVLDLVNVMRDDEVKPWPDPERLLANAPSSSGGFFSVPKVIDVEE